MAVKIRLSRIGKIHAPMYRIIAIDSRKKRDGEALDILGTYNPISGELVQLHNDRIDAWVAKGAIVSDAVKKIQKLFKKGAPLTGLKTSVAAKEESAENAVAKKGAASSTAKGAAAQEKQAEKSKKAETVIAPEIAAQETAAPAQEVAASAE